SPSIHLDKFWDRTQVAGKLFSVADWQKSDEEWNKLHEVRSVVLKSLEEARNNKQIGGNLEAQVRLSDSDSTYPVLEKHKNDLRYLFIVSQVNLTQSSGNGNRGLTVEVRKADG